MLEDLEKLIIFIQQQYKRLYTEWKKSNLYEPIHQKKILVKDINNDNDILNTILNYRSFINDKSLDLKIAFNNLRLNSEVNTRVKAQNSIEYKISNYMSEKHEYGKVPLNKCFNDLYGIRIIFLDNIRYEEIKQFIDYKFNKKLKCNDASNGNYVATHIYFKIDNYVFQWELQI